MILLCYKLEEKRYTTFFLSKKIEIDFKKGEKSNDVSILKSSKNLTTSSFSRFSTRSFFSAFSFISSS